MAKPIASPLVVALGLLLAACAAKPTPYQAAQGGFGYSEQRPRRLLPGQLRRQLRDLPADRRGLPPYRAAELTCRPATTGSRWSTARPRRVLRQRRIAGVRGRGRRGVGRGGWAVFSNGRRGRFRALQCGHGHPGAGRREAAGRPRCLRRLLGDQPAAAKGPRRRLLRGRVLPDPSGNPVRWARKSLRLPRPSHV